MPQKQKKKVTTKKQARKSKKSWIPTLKSRRGLALFVGIFGLVGIGYLIAVNAAPYLKPIDPRQVIAGTYEARPTTIVKDTKTGDAKYLSSSKSQFVLSDGSIICDDANRSGLVKVGEVNNKELERIKKDIATFKKDTDIDTKNVKAQISNTTGVVVSDKKGGENVSYTGKDKKPASVLKLESRLTELCASSAKETIKQEDAVEPLLPSVKQAVNTAPESLLDTIAGIFIGKVYAAPATSAGTATPAFADHLKNRYNQYRVQNRMFAYTTSDCLNYTAYHRAKRLVEANYIFHAPSLLEETLWICNKEGMTWNSWRSVGENVGVNSNAENMFIMYVNSKAHRDNILSPNHRCQGSGAYKSNRHASSFHAFIGAAWTGGKCQR